MIFGICAYLKYRDIVDIGILTIIINQKYYNVGLYLNIVNRIFKYDDDIQISGRFIMICGFNRKYSGVS